MTTETQARIGVYEGMFLATQGAAASFGDLIAHINSLFERANAEVISMKKWDERRLAYEIDKQKRGVYILAYFKCPTDMVPHLERDVVISDKLLRLLITSADHLTKEEIASHDDRAGLDTEAKLREQAGQAEENAPSSKVRLGAPEIQPEPAAKAPVEQPPVEQQAPATPAQEAPPAVDSEKPKTETTES